jgi:hypothetical protein
MYVYVLSTYVYVLSTNTGHSYAPGYAPGYAPDMPRAMGKLCLSSQYVAVHAKRIYNKSCTYMV